MARSAKQRAHITALNTAKVTPREAESPAEPAVSNIKLAVKDTKISTLKGQVELLEKKLVAKEKNLRAKWQRNERAIERHA